MEKTVKIDGKQYQLIYKGKTARLYRELFGTDMLGDLYGIQFTSSAIEKQLKKDMPDADQYTLGFLVYKNIDSRIVDQVFYASLKASQKNKKLKNIDSFLDDIENYSDYRHEALNWLYAVQYGSEPTVQPDTEEETENSEEDEDTKKLS